MADCPDCGGDGVCKDEFHGIVNRTNLFSDDECPECGEPPGSPGDCSTCNGTGRDDA
jgi:hypothetical protein